MKAGSVLVKNYSERGRASHVNSGTAIPRDELPVLDGESRVFRWPKVISEAAEDEGGPNAEGTATGRIRMHRGESSLAHSLLSSMGRETIGEDSGIMGRYEACSRILVASTGGARRRR